ncbi:MAG: tail fiber domain-containing protein [Segatella salivae]
MSDLTATIKGITKQLEAIRDERMPYANTATRIGEAMLSLLSLYQNTPYVKKEGEQQLVIGDIYLSWDKENNAVKVSKADGSAANFYAEGGISAFGAGSMQGSGGSGMSYERLDNWADYSVDKATAVLSAFLGNDLNERLKKVEGGALTSVDWSIIQNKPTSMPASDVPAWAKAATKPSYAWNEITGKPNEFNPAAHSHSFASLLNKPTTLQGYGITDAKIANGTIKLGAEAITPLTAHQDIYALTLQKNGAIIGSFNPKSANATLNIIVPTKLSQLTDDVVSGKYLPLNSNAVSATKLKDSRLLWGQNFDGTGNVTGALSSVTNIDNLIHFIGNNVGIGTNSPLYKLDINGNARVTDELLVDSYLNLANNKGLRLRDKEGHNQRALFISNSNVVYFGCNGRPLYTIFEGSELHFNIYNSGWQDALVITPDKNATFSGNVLARGGVTAYTTSDRRLKTNIKQVDSMQIIRSLGGTWQFDYKDTGEHSIGFIAQSVKDSALKSMVCTNADGYMKLNYLDTRLIALALGAAVQVDDKVERLKKRIKVLEKEVEQLKGGEK